MYLNGWSGWLWLKSLISDQHRSEVDDPPTRVLFNVHPVSSKYLRKNRLSFVFSVYKHIKRQISDKFSSMSDRLSSGKVYYIALFSTYLDDASYKEVQLCWPPLLQEDDLSKDQYLVYINDIVKVYKTNIHSVLWLIGDNFSINCDCPIFLVYR